MPWKRTHLAVTVLVLSAASLGCRTAAPAAGGAGAAAAGERTFAILAINDVYRIEGVDGGRRGHLARLRTLRARLEERYPDLLLLHAGDALFPSFASRTFDGAQMIDVLNSLDGDAAAFDPRMFATLGNHEFDQDDLADAALLDDRIEESAFWWFASNVRFVSGETGLPLVAGHNLLTRTIVAAGGVRVGLFGLTIDNKHPAYVESFADYAATAREQTAALREAGAEVVVALTHLDQQQDAEILFELQGAGPDLVIGGHDHSKQAAEVDGRWILKADADAVTATVVEVTVPAGGGLPRVAHRWVELDDTLPLDPAVAAQVESWGDLHDRLFCAAANQPPGCLAVEIGRTAVELVAEELEIRRFETNLGNWVADRMLEPFDEAGELPEGVPAGLPLVAFVNSGSLRLNQDVAPGPVTRQTIEELFAYPAPLQLIEIDGATLEQVASRAVEGWSGGGWWLQIAGWAFRHDPQAGTATDLTLLTPDGPRPVADDERILAVTQRYLVDPTMGDQDGYDMLGMRQVVAEGPDLKQLVIDALGEAISGGIAPQVEGRICNPVRDELPCLAVGE